MRPLALEAIDSVRRVGAYRVFMLDVPIVEIHRRLSGRGRRFVGRLQKRGCP